LDGTHGRRIWRYRQKYRTIDGLRQLAHSVKDLNGRAYNRTEFVEQRRTMLQAWANYLDTLRQGNVLPLRALSG
jgi:hypothetical protein